MHALCKFSDTANTIGLYANNKYVPTLKDVQRICLLVTRP